MADRKLPKERRQHLRSHRRSRPPVAKEQQRRKLRDLTRTFRSVDPLSHGATVPLRSKRYSDLCSSAMHVLLIGAAGPL